MASFDGASCSNCIRALNKRDFSVAMWIQPAAKSAFGYGCDAEHEYPESTAALISTQMEHLSFMKITVVAAEFALQPNV